jgi:hypothetical protein
MSFPSPEGIPISNKNVIPQKKEGGSLGQQALKNIESKETQENILFNQILGFIDDSLGKEGQLLQINMLRKKFEEARKNINNLYVIDKDIPDFIKEGIRNLKTEEIEEAINATEKSIHDLVELN